MKLAATLPLAAAVVAAALSVSRDASALGPIGIEAGAKIGAGTNPTGDAINPLGFGVGARGGVSLFGIYVGASFMYYLGGSAEVPDTTVKRSGKAMLYGAEVGYNFNILGLLTLRPELGVGAYDGKFTQTATIPTSASGKNLYLEPGLTVVVPIGIFFAGADANALFLPGQSGSKVGFTAHGQLGVTF